MYTASCSNLLAQKFSWIATLLVFMAPGLHCLVSKSSETLKPNIAHYWVLKNPDINSGKFKNQLLNIIISWISHYWHHFFQGNFNSFRATPLPLVGFRSSPATPGVQTRGTPGKATEQAGCPWLKRSQECTPSAGVPWWSWRNWWEMNMDVHPKWSKPINSLHLWSILPCLSIFPEISPILGVFRHVPRRRGGRGRDERRQRSEVLYDWITGNGPGFSMGRSLRFLAISCWFNGKNHFWFSMARLASELAPEMRFWHVER